MAINSRFAVLLAAMSCPLGCATQQAHIVVRDKDTGGPVEGARLGIVFSHNPPFFVAPADVFGMTDQSGTADLKAATGGTLLFEKEGYVTEEKALPADNAVSENLAVRRIPNSDR